MNPKEDLLLAQAPLTQAAGIPQTQGAETALARQAQLLDAFVQDQRYIVCWQENHCRFHLAAALCGGLWCFFRKLWWLGLLMCLADAAIFGAIRHLLSTGKLDHFTSLPPTPFLLLCLLGLTHLPLACMANSIYRSHCTARLAALQRSENDTERQLAKAKHMGGTSAAAAIAGFLLQCMLLVAAARF